MKVVACYSMKGGVGKTATAVNLAYFAAKSGQRTLLIDLDPQGASSFYFRVKPSSKKWGDRFFKAYKTLVKNIKASDFENLDIIPAHLSFRNFDAMLGDLKRRENRLKRVLKGFKHEYDLVILDCPPSIGYLSESIFIASDVVLVPVIPTTLSERTFEQLVLFFKDKKYPLKKIVPFFSMVQAQKSLHKATMEAMSTRRKVFLKTTIPYSSDIEKMGQHKAPVDLFARSTRANAAYIKLWAEISKKHL
ncbi:ParA family protein [Granulosicoccus antarcticus]|uniref:Sporulation initiation inhibitor protein Soj n=1 Tax=Granulosicoccus antarcticus IMCC3135 TaxID=1192854 RepID=A0A2Z2P4I8_9GAMM|nr:AAA family ATPase [Granulosicoccus antarcticus]ASJ76360.1 Sporulation initiation inhibitor protein Soj [Granulosicoccus antarcticus IMCC3135]